MPSKNTKWCAFALRNKHFNGISQTWNSSSSHVKPQAPVLSQIAAPPFTTGFLCRTPCELKKLAYCRSIGLAVTINSKKLLQMSLAFPCRNLHVFCVLSMQKNNGTYIYIHDSEKKPVFPLNTPKKKAGDSRWPFLRWPIGWLATVGFLSHLSNPSPCHHPPSSASPTTHKEPMDPEQHSRHIPLPLTRSPRETHR